MFKMMGLVVLVTAASDAAQVPGFIYMVVTLVGAGGLFRFFMIRSERRMQNAGATKNEAEAAEIADRVRRDLMAEMDVKMQTARQEARAANTARATAEADLRVVIAKHEADIEIWHRERHDLINKGLDKDAKILTLEKTVEALEAKVQAMEIRLGFAEGRRESDDVTQGRMAVLESRADASDASITAEQDRNTRIEARADRAQVVAEEQELRNDDTPGHA